MSEKKSDPPAEKSANSKRAKPPAADSRIPEVPRKEDASETAKPAAFDKGTYVSSLDGEPYALSIDRDDPAGRTHKCKNSAHFWEGTEDEFKAVFTKK